MTLGEVLGGEQVRLRAVDGVRLWDFTEKVDEKQLKNDPLATVNLIHYSSSDTDISTFSLTHNQCAHTMW
jgi:hypothetical protein